VAFVFFEYSIPLYIHKNDVSVPPNQTVSYNHYPTNCLLYLCFSMCGKKCAKKKELYESV